MSQGHRRCLRSSGGLFAVLAAVVVVAGACTSGLSTPSVNVVEASQPAESAGASEPSSTPNAEPLRIGMIVPLTGFAAQIGLSAQAGANLALKEKGGSVDGRPIEFIPQDDGCSPENAVNALNRISDQVVAVVGPACSAAAGAVAPATERLQLPTLSSAYVAQLTEQGNQYFFRPSPSDRFVLRVIVNALTGEGLGGKVALVRDTSAYGSASGEALTEELQAAALPTPVVDAAFDLGATDYTGQVQAVKNSDPDAIVIVSFEAQSGLFIKQARQLGLDAPIWVLYDKKVLSDPAGAAVDGVRYVTRFSVANPQTEEFSAKIQQEFQVEADDSTKAYYGATLALIDALDRAGADATGATLMEALRTTDIDTSVGTFSFDEHGDLQQPSVVVGIFKGQTPTMIRVVNASDLN